MGETKSRRNKKLVGISVLIIFALAFLIYFDYIPQFSPEIVEEGNQEVVEVILAAEDSTEDLQDRKPIRFTGNIIHEEKINEEGMYIFNKELLEKSRLGLEGSFEQPVTFLVLHESYYNAWLRDGVVKTHKDYIKDPTDIFSTRIDINENEGGVFYFIIQSEEGKINGEVKIIELAKL